MTGVDSRTLLWSGCSWGHVNATPAIPRYRAIIVAVFAAVCLTDLTRALLLADETTEMAVSVIDLAVLVVLQVSYFRQLNATQRHLVLAAQGALLIIPYALFGHSWAGVAGLVAGNALLVLRPKVGWSIFIATVVATGLAQTTHGEAMTATAATALLLAGLATGFATHRDWPSPSPSAPTPNPSLNPSRTPRAPRPPP